jgi:hypothetical protein
VRAWWVWVRRRRREVRRGLIVGRGCAVQLVLGVGKLRSFLK